jgi:hypothetical protein
MAANDKAAPANIPLHERMEARGAKKHRRKSTLARFMIERAAEMRRLVEVDRYSWKDIAAMLSEDEGLTDNKGNPITETVARITWSRIKAGRKPRTARVGAGAATAAPALQPAHEPAREEEALKISHAPLEAPADRAMQLDIRPASLRPSAADTAQPAQKGQQIPGVRLLPDPVTKPPADDPAEPPPRRKIPPAPIL